MVAVSTKDFVAKLTEEEKQQYLDSLTDERWKKLIKESRDYIKTTSSFTKEA